MTTNSTDRGNLPRIIRPKRHSDERGWVSESFHPARLRECGIACDFVQDNQSASKRVGTLRGFHFQSPPAAQAKLVGVMRGRILDVVVDIRSGSPTYGKYVSIELSAESAHQLYIPVGFAHGFVTLEDNVLVMYKISHHYAPAYESGIRWNDPEVAFPWPIEHIKLFLSEKDRNLPLLKEFTSPFLYDGQPLVPLSVTELA
jgi:dTDP-4-dehydrorhamnose 3,5-epimerase